MRSPEQPPMNGAFLCWYAACAAGTAFCFYLFIFYIFLCLFCLLLLFIFYCNLAGGQLPFRRCQWLPACIIHTSAHRVAVALLPLLQYNQFHVFSARGGDQRGGVLQMPPYF
jgi:hypothetical protein